MPGGKDGAEANRDLARRLVEEVFNGGNLGVLDEIYAPDYRPGNGCFSRGRRGLSELKQLLAALRAAHPDLRVTVEDQVALGDWVATRCMAGGAPGRGPHIPATFTIRVKGGRIVEDWYQSNVADALKQLGASNSPSLLGGGAGGPL